MPVSSWLKEAFTTAQGLHVARQVALTRAAHLHRILSEDVDWKHVRLRVPRVRRVYTDQERARDHVLLPTRSQARAEESAALPLVLRLRRHGRLEPRFRGTSQRSGPTPGPPPLRERQTGAGTCAFWNIHFRQSFGCFHDPFAATITTLSSAWLGPSSLVTRVSYG